MTTVLPPPIDVRIVSDPEIPFFDAANNAGPQYVTNWDSFIGQQRMKNQFRVYIEEAIQNASSLPHTLLAASSPGVGKTTLARLIAQELEVKCVMMVPPFSPRALHEAAMSLEDGEILFIDEVHKLGDGGPRQAENLLHIMEEKVLYLDSGVIKLNDFTIIGATTDADKLPESIIDRFVIKPYFQPYSLEELVRITKNFCNFYDIILSGSVMVAIARACRGLPRVARELVVGAKALQSTAGRQITPTELLEFKEVEPDGTTAQHKAYLSALYRMFGRQGKDGWEYIAGESSLMTLLRENKNGVARLERFLIERGLIDRTPRGRRLTHRGIIAARTYATENSGNGC